MAEKTRHAESTDRPLLRLMLQLLGYATCIAYLIGGGAILIILLIGGFWAGFARTAFTLMFLALALYIPVTAWVAFRFARRPTKRAGIVLAGLVLPAAIYIAAAGGDRPDLRASAETYVASDDPAEVAQARSTLVEQGRRAGNPPQVRVLLKALKRTDDDAEQIRLVELLGEISYQNEAVLAELERIIDETGAAPERIQLHEAAKEAAGQVNPYR